MVNPTLKINLVGIESDEDKISLADFTNELSAIYKTLTKLEQHLNKAEGPSFEFRVVELGKQSPPFIMIESHPLRPENVCENIVFDRFVTGIEHIKQNKKPEYLDLEALEFFREFGNSLQKKIRKIEFQTNGTQTFIDKKLTNNINNIVGSDEVEWGSITGFLEKLNVHKGNRNFTIYPISGAKKIDCTLDEKIINDAIGAVKKRVRFDGDIYYKRYSRYPYRMRAKRIEIFPDDSVLPSANDLYGMLKPEVTNG